MKPSDNGQEGMNSVGHDCPNPAQSKERPVFGGGGCPLASFWTITYEPLEYSAW